MPGWYGYLGEIKFEIDEDWKKLDNYTISRREEGMKLDSFIKFDPMELRLDDGTPLISGMIYYEFLRKTKNIIKDEKGFPKVIQDKTIIDTGWSNFWFTTRSFIIVRDKKAKTRLFEIMIDRFNKNPDDIVSLTFNLDNIFHDYTDQWSGGFVDREGHIHSGSFFGEDIIHDDELGIAYTRTRHKNQVGFVTEYFDGAEIKIRVTNSGFIQIFTNIENDPNRAFEFIRDELSGYIEEQ